MKIPFWIWSMTGLLFPSPPAFCATNWYSPSSDLSTLKMYSVALCCTTCQEENFCMSDMLSTSPFFIHVTGLSEDVDFISPRSVTFLLRLLISITKWTYDGSIKNNNLKYFVPRKISHLSHKSKEEKKRYIIFYHLLCDDYVHVYIECKLKFMSIKLS